MGRQLKRRLALMLYTALGFLAIALALRLAGPGRVSSAPGSVEAQAALPAAAPVELGNEQLIARLQARLQRNPDDDDAYALLGLALLQRVRETADPALYSRAETAFAEALERNPQQLDALIGQGMLALARHDFTEALTWAEAALRLNPHRAQIYGIRADAQIELGRYDQAEATLQQMVDLRPDLSSYSRISYLRELHGDRPGAITAMQKAVAAGGPTAENRLWAQVQLGHLYFNQADLENAERNYRQALQIRPDYVPALAGLARVRAAQGRYEAAIGAYEGIVERLPWPQFVTALGQLYQLTGRPAEAQQQYELVQVIDRLNAEAGANVDLESALFQADYGSDPGQALRQARTAYERRPSIYAADALAWALYKNKKYDEAARYSREALRLGSRDALLYYHAGMIAQARGRLAEAQARLEEALAINPHFDILQARTAQSRLAQLRQK